jgi:hypothetical protein
MLGINSYKKLGVLLFPAVQITFGDIFAPASAPRKAKQFALLVASAHCPPEADQPPAEAIGAQDGDIVANREKLF